MATSDRLYRFIFDNTDVRGEIIGLEDSYARVLGNSDYPPVVGRLLGEMLAASGLLSATLKFDGTLALQARGDGPLSLIMADCSHQRQLRAIAHTRGDLSPHSEDFTELLGRGNLAITVDPARGERYQGIVPLEAPTLAGCLEGYFSQSEQLATRLWLFADGERAGGLLLQALPARDQSPEERDRYWSHLAALADTLDNGEFLDSGSETLLHRLFHREQVRLFEPAALTFGCSCSRERTATMLVNLGEQEVRDILREQGTVEIQCQFCHQFYHFDEQAVADLFGGQERTLH